jgi:hypothetical protein
MVAMPAAAWAIPVLAPLVQHDLTLVLELGVGERRQQVTHAIRFIQSASSTALLGTTSSNWRDRRCRSIQERARFLKRMEYLLS